MYAYRADFLERFRDLPPGHLERLERLEQLRALENGYTIRVGITDHGAFGIDTPEDADAFTHLLKAGKGR
jgi:3-deoxy-manno-octulosonate cytidylyltransferase (CMP-KDO synthetase)